MEPFLAQLEPLCLVAFRLSGLFVFAPMLASVAIPPRVKVLLCLALTVALFGLVKSSIPRELPSDFFSFAALGIGETIIGALIGLLALIPVIAVQISGVIMSQQMGIGLATVFNPALDIESDAVADILLQLAMVAFVLMGGLETIFLTLATSYSTLPIGGFSLHDAPLSTLTGLITTGCELALRVSTPLLGIIFVEVVASSILMKTIPQINIMSLGYGLKVVLGLLALILAYRAIGDAVIEHLNTGAHEILKWVAPAFTNPPPTPSLGEGILILGVAHG